MTLADTFFVVFEAETDIDLNAVDWFDPVDVGLGDDVGMGIGVGIEVCIGSEVNCGKTVTV